MEDLPPDPSTRLPDLPPDPGTRMPDGPPDPSTRMPDAAPALQPARTQLPVSVPLHTGGFTFGDYDDREQDRLYTAMFNVDEVVKLSPEEARQALKNGVRALGNNQPLTPKQEAQKIKLESKLASFPRLYSWMAQSPEHGAAVQNEVDKWGVLEKIFGRYTYDQQAVSTRNEALSKGLPDPGLPDPTYEHPLKPLVGALGAKAPVPGVPKTEYEKQISEWSKLDYLFGKTRFNPAEVEARNQALQAGLPDPGAPVNHYEDPGWVQAFGRTMYNFSNGVKNWFLSLYGGGVDPELIKKEKEIGQTPVPGDFDPELRKVNSIIGMSPVLAAGAIHPAIGFGAMYAEVSGHNYEDLRLEGWDHDAARDVSNLIGFTSASVGAALGPLFKFNFLPVQYSKLAGYSIAPALNQLVKSPSFKNAVWGYSKDFAAGLLMNTAMATAEIGMREAFESAAKNRPYDFSRVVSTTKDAADSWVEMAFMALLPAYKSHAERRLRFEPQEQAKKLSTEISKQMTLAQNVYDEYHDKGHALRSMHNASEIVSAVQSLKDSEFMQSNPDEAHALIKHMTSPRRTQTVFIDPKAVMNLTPESAVQLGVLDHALGLGQEGRVPLNIVDFLSHPEAEGLVSQVAGEADLLKTGEAAKVNFEEMADATLAAIEQARNVGTMTEEQYKRFQLHLAALARQAETGRKPVPEEAPRRQRQTEQPEPPTTERELRAWAEDVVSRRPGGELAEMSEHHDLKSQEANKLAYDAMHSASMHAEQGRSPDEAREQARQARQRASADKAVSKAAEAGAKEHQGFVQALSDLAADKPDKSGLNPREQAWAAGAEYGEAFDAILEALNFSKERGYRASDLTDVYDKMAKLRRLPGDVAFTGWDLELTNKILMGESKKDANDRSAPTGLAPPTRPINSLTLTESRELGKALQQIVNSVKAENEVRVQNNQISNKLAVEMISDHLKNIKDLTPQELQDRSKKNKADRSFNKEGLQAMLNQPHTLFFKMGPVGDSIWFDGFVAGVAREERMSGELAGKYKKIEEGFSQDLRSMGEEMVPAVNGGPPVKRSEVWRLVLHLGVEGVDQKIVKGMGIKDVSTLYEWVHDNIAPNGSAGVAREVMQKLITPHWKIFDGLWTEYERHFKERGLAPPEHLKSRKITIHGEQYEGGYGGRLEWLDLDGNKPSNHPGSLEALLAHDVDAPNTPNRHLRERGESFQGKVILDWDGVLSSAKAEIHDIALRPFVEDAHKMLSDGSVRDLLKRKLGPDALDEIYNPYSKNQTSWLHTVARGYVGDVTTAKALTKAMGTLQGHLAYNVFSLNFRVLLGQLSHLPAAGFGLGITPMHWSAGAVAAFSPDRRARAHSVSEVLRLRSTNFQQKAEELARQLTGFEPGKDAVRRSADELNYAAWHEMDAFLSHAIFEMGFSKEMAKWKQGDPLSHDAAVRAGEKAVTVMMPAQDIYGQSAFTRDRHVAAFAFMVRNFPNTLYNAAALQYWEARVSGETLGRPKAAALTVGMLMAAEVLGKGLLMSGGAPEHSTDPEEWWLTRAAASVLYPYMLSNVGQGAYEASKGNVRGVHHEMKMMTPAAFSLMASVGEDVANLLGNGDTEKALRSAAHLTSLILKSTLPTKAYDISNAARNADSPGDAAKKSMGYRQ